MHWLPSQLSADWASLESWAPFRHYYYPPSSKSKFRLKSVLGVSRTVYFDIDGKKFIRCRVNPNCRKGFHRVWLGQKSCRISPPANPSLFWPSSRDVLPYYGQTSSTQCFRAHRSRVSNEVILLLRIYLDHNYMTLWDSRPVITIKWRGRVIWTT